MPSLLRKKSVPFPLSYLGTCSFAPFHPTSPPELLAGSLVLPGDSQQQGLLITALALRGLTPDSPGLFLPLWLSVVRLLCWLLLLYPISNLGVFQHLFLLPFSPLSLTHSHSLGDLMHSHDLQFYVHTIYMLYPQLRILFWTADLIDFSPCVIPSISNSVCGKLASGLRYPSSPTHKYVPLAIVSISKSGTARHPVVQAQKNGAHP